MRQTWWALVASAALAGCGGGSGTCVSGSTVECACPGGTKGVQTCQADGAFGTCACGTTPSNSAPSAPVVQVAPSSPTDTQDLVCTVAQASSDPNGDTLTYQFAWTKNGQPFAAAVANTTSSTVSADATSAGDVFACAASASDGKTTGPSSAAVSVTVTAANRAPTAPVVTLTPASPTDAQDLVCSIGTPSTDADGDALTYQFAWTKNGQPFAGAVATGALASTVSAANTSAGDAFACAATANDGKVAGPASATVSVTVQASTWASCKALITAASGTPDGLYDIDPDGVGGVAPVKAFCDMTNGGWTLVANIYDSAGDDAPNTTDYVVSGWQQTASGQWASAASKVERNASGTGSSAVSLAFVAALKSNAGQQNLKMCFVHQNGTDTVCRSSADSTLTLVSYPTGNPKLTVYSGNTLPYTYGRLAGLAGSADGYDYSKYSSYSAGLPIPRTPGSVHDFGTESTGIADYYNGSICACADGAWHGYGQGSSFKPADIGNCELGSCMVACQPGSAPSCDPTSTTYGFRLYVGP